MEKGRDKAFPFGQERERTGRSGAPTARQSCAAIAIAILRRKAARHACSTARGKAQNMCNFVGNCGCLHERKDSLGEAAFGLQASSWPESRMLMRYVSMLY